MGPLVSEEQLQWVTGFLKSGVADGATTLGLRLVRSCRRCQEALWRLRALARRQAGKPPGQWLWR
jgi:hypothetical protein